MTNGREMAGNFTFTIAAFRFTKNGGVKMTLEISEQEAAKALALALYTDAVWTADVFAVKP